MKRELVISLAVAAILVVLVVAGLVYWHSAPQAVTGSEEAAPAQRGPGGQGVPAMFGFKTAPKSGSAAKGEPAKGGH